MDVSNKILYVEDNLDNQMLLSYYVKRTPYEVAFAEDGRTAIEKLQQQSFDFALIDMNLNEEMNGLELARYIRTELHLTQLPIAILSAFSVSDLKEQAQEVHIQEFITKPIKKEALIAIFERYLR